jgi:hypothetical protein
MCVYLSVNATLQKHEIKLDDSHITFFCNERKVDAGANYYLNS